MGLIANRESLIPNGESLIPMRYYNHYLLNHHAKIFVPNIIKYKNLNPFAKVFIHNSGTKPTVHPQGNCLRHTDVELETGNLIKALDLNPLAMPFFPRIGHIPSSLSHTTQLNPCAAPFFPLLDMEVLETEFMQSIT